MRINEKKYSVDKKAADNFVSTAMRKHMALIYT